MMKHADIWRAVDQLATRYGMSASGLARRSGLDPTTFNKSKRITREGKQRWPSTESVAKVLDATGASLAELVSLVGDGDAAALSHRLPLLDYSQAGQMGRFNEKGVPVGKGWDEVLFPQIADRDAYALEILGAELEPVYRDGDLIVVSPAANVRRGDRVLVKTRDGTLMARQLMRQSALKVELGSISSHTGDEVLDAQTIAWMSRIVWASQ
jgi:phage repressor protein C with HTH and peptisase S24 domain